MPTDEGEATSTIYRIAVRFGDAVLQAGFTSVPNLVLNHYAKLGISVGEMMFTIHIWQYWWTEKDPYPSLRAIARKMNVSQRQIHNYVASLRKKGHLLVNQRHSPGLGQMTSEYDFSPLIQSVVKLASGGDGTPLKDSSGGGVKNTSGAPLKPTSPEEYEGQEYEENNNTQPSNDLESPTTHKQGKKPFSKKQFENLKNFDEKEQTQTEPEHQEADAPRPLPPSKNSPTPVGEILATRRKTALRRPKTALETASPGRAGASDQGRRGRPPTAPEQIAWLIGDLSSEFHDEDVVDSNTGQAARLYRASRLSEAAFCQLVYEARAITKDRMITKPAKGQAGEYGLRNKMPYFFKVLRDLLGMKEQGSGEGPTAPDRTGQVNEHEASPYQPPPNYQASLAQLKAQARKLSTRTPE